MSLRKQPDRQVKKKRKIEMPENLDIKKSKYKLEEPGKFDIVGNLLCNYGLTGANLAREIFSYMDISSLQGGYLEVCKAWNLFLTNDRKLWMNKLRQTQPYLELLDKQLLDEDFASETKICKEFFDHIEKNDIYCCSKVIQIFKRIQIIHVVLQDVIQDCPVYEVFQKELIGEKLNEEIQSQIDRAEKEKHKCQKLPEYDNCFESNFAALFAQITELKVRCDELRYQREIDKYLIPLFDQNVMNVYQKWLEKENELSKSRRNKLLLGIKITLLAVSI